MLGFSLIALCTVAGCATGPTNPAFPSRADAQASMGAMAATPMVPARPIVILGGYMDPGLLTASLERAVRDGTAPDAQIITVNFGGCTSFAQCRERVLDATRALQDREADVITNSMGGVVARYAAMDSAQIKECGLQPGAVDPPLSIHSLYTISAPHRGAKMADGPASSPMTKDMRQGSAFLACLDHALERATYTLYCYGRTDDSIVGTDRCAPAGHTLLWVDTPPFEMAHVDAYRDPRIVADILTHIRADATAAH